MLCAIFRVKYEHARQCFKELPENCSNVFATLNISYTHEL